jgi:ribonuclease R
MIKKTIRIEQEIIAFLKKQKGNPFKQRRIAKALRISEAQYPGFKENLRRLAEEGQIERIQKNCYRIPDASRQVVGMISFSGHGFAFVTTAEGEELFVGSYDTGTAFQGDKVLVEKYQKQSGKRMEGKVIRVIERSSTPIFGVLRKKQREWVVTPESPAPPVTILVRNFPQGIQSGQMVELCNLEWNRVNYLPRADIRQVIGVPGDPQDDIPIILKMFRIESDFPAEVTAEAENLPEIISTNEIQQRRDLRDQVVFTIDPETAMDFDDAVSLEELDSNHWRLGVHIADVSHYVQAGTGLDREAFKRGTSIYLGNTVVPMLPAKISNELCSLRPGEDRLTLSVILDLTPNGNLSQYEIVPSIIRSAYRFSYREVQNILDQGAGPDAEVLLKMRDLSQLLYHKRLEAGSIDFDVPEPIFNIGKDGIPEEIRPSERLQSHRLIEEFMLLTNRCIAEWVGVRRKLEKLPFVYRIHATPPPDAIAELYSILFSLGLNYQKPARVKPQDIRQILLDVENLPFKNFIERLAIRSMAKAVYSARPLSHFGLAFRHYTHFTAPIRRYPDLIVHRLVKHYLHSVIEEDKIFFRRLLPKVADHSSETEQTAMEVEREFIKIKQIRFLADKVGNWYKGIITGVMEFGFFVEISDYLVEGLVHVRTLLDDYYIYDRANHTLKGRRDGRTFRLGDRVSVKIVSVSVKERRIDLEWGE